jgi:hypothetical protein
LGLKSILAILLFSNIRSWKLLFDATFAKMRDEFKDSKIKEKTLLDLTADKL